MRDQLIVSVDAKPNKHTPEPGWVVVCKGRHFRVTRITLVGGKGYQVWGVVA